MYRSVSGISSNIAVAVAVAVAKSGDYLKDKEIRDAKDDMDTFVNCILNSAKNNLDAIDPKQRKLYISVKTWDLIEERDKHRKAGRSEEEHETNKNICITKLMKTNCATLLIHLNKEPALKKSGKESRTAKANVYQPSLDKKILEETESYLRKRQKQ